MDTGKSWKDPTQLLKANNHLESGITLEIIPGTVDLVSWNKTKFFFGDSFANLNEGQVGILSEIIKIKELYTRWTQKKTPRTVDLMGQTKYEKMYTSAIRKI